MRYAPIVFLTLLLALPPASGWAEDIEKEISLQDLEDKDLSLDDLDLTNHLMNGLAEEIFVVFDLNF